MTHETASVSSLKMKQKILEFVQESGGTASAIAIVRHVMHLRNATAVMAERILQPLLADDPRFVADGLGNWVLAQNVRIAEVEPQAVLIETPMQSREIARENCIILSWSLPNSSQIKKPEIAAIAVTQATASPTSEFPPMPIEEFLARILPILRKSVLVSWKPRPVIAAVQRLAAQAGEYFFPTISVSLSNLARNILKTSKSPKLPELHVKLFAGREWQEGLVAQMLAEIDILAALLERCRAQGLNRWEEIAEFAKKPETADFSAYEFDERFVQTLPELPGVYLMRDRKKKVIYVGKAANLRSRVSSYFAASHPDDAKLQQLRSRIKHLTFKTVDTELDALLLENQLIQRHQPAVNKQLLVHGREDTQPERLRGIFLVPFRPSPTPATDGRIIVYFLTPLTLKKVAVNVRRKPAKRLRQALDEMFRQMTLEQQSEASNGRITTQSEIASRWLRVNQSWISSFDPLECVDEAEAEANLLALLRAPEIFETTVRLATAISPERTQPRLTKETIAAVI